MHGVCLDFDGVVHSYVSGWDGIDIIQDPPTPNSFESIKSYLDMGWNVYVFSVRSRLEEGRKAMREWFIRHGMDNETLEKLQFPTSKPRAVLYIDDRAYQFKGEFPTVSYIEKFKPWNK